MAVALAGLVMFGAWLAFWAVVSIGEQAARPSGLGAQTHLMLTPLDGAGQPLPGAAPLRGNHDYPFEYIARERDLRVAQVRVDGQFIWQGAGTATDNADSNLALLLTARSAVRAFRVNGIPISADVRQPRLNGSFVPEPATYSIPAAVLRPGSNDYSLTVDRSLRGPFVVPAFVLGPQTAVIGPGQLRYLMSVEFALIGIVVMIFTALLALSVDWPPGERRRNIYFVIMLSLSAAGAIMFMFSSAQKYAVAWLALSATLTMIQAISLLLYVRLDCLVTQTLSRRSTLLVILGLLTAAFTVAVTQYRGINPNYHLVLLMITCRLFAVGISIFAAGMLALEVVRSGGQRFAERFVFIMWFIATAMDQGHPGLFTVYSPYVAGLAMSLQWTPILGSLTGLAKIASLARQAGEARRTVISANAELQEQLAAREQELNLSYVQREQLAARQAMLEERQRLVRDMHDGIGGQLLGLMMQARSGQIAPQQMATGLQTSLADLRLIVDSMDTAEAGLAASLHSFEHRVRPQIESAGMTLSVTHALPDVPINLGPRPTLQVLRILQEGVTNAIVHSRAKSVRVISDLDAAGQVRLQVMDDGVGLSETTSHGRGLASMRGRAGALGGTISITGNAQGTSIILTVPTGSPQVHREN